MNVMYIADEPYAYIAGISIRSLLENNKSVDCINIYLVNDGISFDNLDKIRRTVTAFNRNLIVINKPNIKEIIGFKVKTPQWKENVFARLFLDTVLSDYQDIERLIYIDCDTLVVGNLKDLWETDLNGKVVAGVLEAMGNLHKRALGLSSNEPYFNSGVILFDVKKWKKNEYERKAVEFIRKTKGNLEYVDESVINGIASRSMQIISPKYNFTSLSIYFTRKEVMVYRKPSFHYSENELNEARRDARIVHFTSTFMDVRPWIEGCRHPYAEAWKEYKSKSMWSDIPMQKDNRCKKKILLRKLAMLLPHDMRLMCTGFIHAYIKSLKYLITSFY